MALIQIENLLIQILPISGQKSLRSLQKCENVQKKLNTKNSVSLYARDLFFNLIKYGVG